MKTSFHLLILSLSLLATVARGGWYDYKKALKLSNLFYEAQRSGYLPRDQRVKWRKTSATKDRGQKGEDLTGGYYDGMEAHAWIMSG
jgi:hypothetical protein